MRVILAIIFLVWVSIPPLLPIALILGLLPWTNQIFWGDWLTILFALTVLPSLVWTYAHTFKSEMSHYAPGILLQRMDLPDFMEVIAERMRIKRIRLYILDVEGANAFAWSSPLTRNVVMSQGLLSAFTVRELQFVFAHELSHIRCRDSNASRLWNAFSLMALKTRRMLSVLVAHIFGVWVGRQIFWLLDFWNKTVLFLLSPFDAWASRRIELRADRDAAKVTSPMDGVSVFTKIPSGQIEPLFWMSSHPRNNARISKLKAML